MQNAFGDNLWRIMRERGVSQQKLANMCNIPQSAISQYCHGKANTPIDRAAIIAKALGVSLDALCGLDEEREISPREWFDYTMRLVDNPPTVNSMPRPGEKTEKLPLITFDEKRHVLEFRDAIAIHGENMRKFFNAYFAIKNAVQMDEKTFHKTITPLFEQYEFLFTPGYDLGGDNNGK